MRVELTHHLTYYTGALLGLAAVTQAHIVHTEEHAPLDGFEAVPCIREGTGHNHGHRVVYVRGAHLVVYLYLLNVAGSFYLLQRIFILVVIHIFPYNL